MSEARSILQARWEDNAHARCKRSSRGDRTSEADPRRPLGNRLCPERSTEADAGGVKLPFPRQYRMEPKTPWGAHAAKVAIAGRERTRYGYTQFDWVAEVGQTHRASRTPGGRKACW
jgi:hypothetical protein